MSGMIAIKPPLQESAIHLKYKMDGSVVKKTISFSHFTSLQMNLFF